MTIRTGTMFGGYEIVGPLGAGGMGEVYRARDSKLKREVAIKVLPDAFSRDAERAARFQREAEILASLNHPHIAAIYDLAESGETRFLVLELVEGETLAERIARGPLQIDKTIEIARQMTEALESAHERGIIHRDLKPANVKITPDGTVKVLDFGIAKMGDAKGDGDDPSNSPTVATATMPGMILGTAAYMSPEQAEGKSLDRRSDVFSFGAVLYEMISGNPAFAGHSMAEVLSAVLRDTPRPLRAGAEFERIVARCLAKHPAQRFQTMKEVNGALAKGSGKSADHEPSIAVLPFANMSGDKEQEYFSDGLAEEIINALTHIPGLKITARTSAFAFRGKEQDITKIAEVLRVRTVLEGSVRRAGNRIRVTAQLINAEDGYHLWSERYDREMADIFAIQDDIAQSIAGALQLKLVGTPAELQHKPALPAYEALLRGRHHLFKFSPESWTRAKESFEKAIALDPAYAEAHAYLGLGYFFGGTNGLLPLKDVAHLVRASAQKALALKPSDVGPRFLLGSIAAAHDYDWKAAGEHFDAVFAADPVVPNARWAYASLYSNPLGRFQESVAKMQIEVELDPLNVQWHAILASHLGHAGMRIEAITEAKKALDLDENSWVAWFDLAEFYIADRRFAEAVAAGEKAYQIAPWHSFCSGILAAALVRVGERDRALALIQQMGDNPLPVWGRIMYHLLCSEVDAAADWYEKAIHERDPFAVIFCQAPYVRILQESPRWPKLAQMMNLPPLVTGRKP